MRLLRIAMTNVASANIPICEMSSRQIEPRNVRSLEYCELMSSENAKKSTKARMNPATASMMLCMIGIEKMSPRENPSAS